MVPLAIIALFEIAIKQIAGDAGEGFVYVTNIYIAPVVILLIFLVGTIRKIRSELKKYEKGKQDVKQVSPLK